MLDTGLWTNEPRQWSRTDGRLEVVTDEKTDFWRQTHYGFTRDSGHFLGVSRHGDFTAQLRIQARYEALYDQAGLMVRIDSANWIKAGIEQTDGMACLGSVLTIGASDWATGAYAGDPSDVWLRVTVANGVLRLQASGDGRSWPLVRLCPFPRAERYEVGPMCCTPERGGLTVSFSNFSLGDPRGTDLHDLG
ncbi:regulation of enolase 1 [Aureimonas sp. Leaf454]|uniref:DUF1349 domain-containing protein n=1 Tax=Aureimonas sp. Leaf454 TaxID=1736381 RepID=UPI0006FADECC|nr:DUF1349 domain-containing protein [Aureimonas sp. Leaf454]KQT46285.1 regulation of enolase 1 [Aureimonas sp. Leaf454]